MGACIESNVNGEFTDVSYLTCLKLVLMSSQNWDTSPKNLHSQRPLKIAPSEITGQALPRLQLAAATEAFAPLLAEPGPSFAAASRHHLWCHWPDYFPDQLTLKAFRCSPWCSIKLLSLLQCNASKIWSSYPSRKYIPFHST